MKTLFTGYFTARKILCLVSIYLLSGPLYAADKAEEADLDWAYAPEDFGFYIGMPEQELFTALASHGMSFKEGGKYERVQGSKTFAPMMDFALVISEAAGARDVWDSETVLLGVKDGALVAVGRHIDLSRFEGLQTFKTTTTTLQESLGTATGLFPRYKAKRRKNQKAIDQFNEMIWYSDEWPNSKAKPESWVWPQGEVITIFTVRYNVSVGQALGSNNRELSLWYLHFCSFPMMDKILPENNFNCK
jgi:hypothetical protein